ncbi:MAG: hypothetical protein WB560_14960, partial [Desulfobaccales bacterium]
GKAAQAEGDLKVKMDKDIHEIEEMMDDLEKKLETMKSAIGKDWEELKAKADAAVEGVEKAVEKVEKQEKAFDKAASQKSR